MNEKILLIIPIYNCYNYFFKMLPLLKKYNINMLIVDDGSYSIPENAIKKNKIKLIKHKKNKGKGETLKTGFSYALKHGFTHVITIDGDYQHDPGDIQKFLKKINNFDLIIGNRNFKNKKMPFHRKLSNYLTSKILSFLLKYKINDAQSGFRLIKTSVLKKINLKTSKYDLENELLIKTIKNNFKVGFVPIKTTYNNSNSNIHGFMDTIRFIKVVIKYGF